jgi:glutamine amidotransferase
MIAIIDYGIGNIESVKNALDRLDMKSKVSGDVTVLSKANGFILPGVGSANEGMSNLKRLMLDIFIKDQIEKGKPFLGICLGMQLLFDTSEEGNTSCLGILKGTVRKFRKERKVPQIGWNEVIIHKINEKFVKKIPNPSCFYFINSYYCLPKDKSIIAGTSVYGDTFASFIVSSNIYATQFHPEKSGKAGFQLLLNFIRRCI